MRRLLTLWLTFLAAFWLAWAGSSALFVGRVRKDFGAVLLLVAAPALQAGVAAWLMREPGSVPWLSPWRQAARRPLWLAVMIGEVALLAAGWALPEHPLLALTAQGPAPAGVHVQALVAGGELLVAAGVVLALLVGGGWRGWRDGEKALLGLWASALLAIGGDRALYGLAVNLGGGGLTPLPRAFLPGQPRLLRCLVAEGTWLALATALLLGVEWLLLRPRERRDEPSGGAPASAGADQRDGTGPAREAARALDWALGLLFLSAMAALVGYAQGPRLRAPWGLLAATFASLAATSNLLAALLGFDRIAPRSPGRP